MEVQILLSPQNNINIYGEMAKLEDATEYNEQIECVHIEKKRRKYVYAWRRWWKLSFIAG